MKYRPEIDGLRAIAILPVIFFHVGFETFSGGYTGVDVFFVISGFLITTIIYSELEQQKFSIINFYERRSRRILPLLFFVLLITFPFAWISLFQVDMVDYFESLVSTSLFYSNFLFAFEANYFDASVELKPLLHTWSLAVEEQYYILFPLLMIMLWKFNLKKIVLTLLVVFAVISFIIAEWASINYPTHNFYLLPSRAWELAVGALMAIAIKKSLFKKLRDNSILSETLSLLGFLLILIGFFIIKHDTPFPGVYAIFPTFGSVLVIGFANSKNIIGKLLSMRVFVFVGLISYSAYLWHHPLFAFAKHLSLTEGSFFQKMILTLSVIPLSYLSWKYVENPFRNKKKYSRKFIFLFSAIGSLFFVTIGCIGIQYNGFPNRKINAKLEYLKYFPDNRQLQIESWKFVRQAEENFKNSSWFERGNKLPNVLLIGNSHSKDLYNTFLSSQQFQNHFEIARYEGEVRNLSKIGNGLYKSKNYQDADVIIVVSHYYKEDLDDIEPLVNRLLRDNKKVVLVKEPYGYKIVNSRTMADVAIQRYLSESINTKSKDSILVNSTNKASYENRIIKKDILKKQSDLIIDKIALKNENVIILNRNDYICNEKEQLCFVLDYQFQKFNYDLKHTTLEGAAFFGKRIDKIQWLKPIIELYHNADKNNTN